VTVQKALGLFFVTAKTGEAKLRDVKGGQVFFTRSEGAVRIHILNERRGLIGKYTIPVSKVLDNEIRERIQIFFLDFTKGNQVIDLEDNNGRPSEVVLDPKRSGHSTNSRHPGAYATG
jgi:hypothetical protein